MNILGATVLPPTPRTDLASYIGHIFIWISFVFLFFQPLSLGDAVIHENIFCGDGCRDMLGGAKGSVVSNCLDGMWSLKKINPILDLYLKEKF